MSKDEELRAVMYSDGGFGDGIMSGGVHAYLYGPRDNKTVKFSGWTITDKGYVSNEKQIPNTNDVKPLFYYDASCRFRDIDSEVDKYSSGLSETLAIKFGVIELLKEYPTLNKIVIRTDSEINVKIFSNPNPKESALSKYLLEVKDIVKERGVELELIHVRGHMNEIGNEITDTFASVGKRLKEDVTIHRIANGYWNKSKDRNPFINGRRIMHITNGDEVPGIYKLINVLEPSFMGRIDPKGLGYSVYVGKPEEYIETIKNKLDRITDDVLEVGNINLNAIYTGFNFRYNKMFGDDAYFVDKKNKNIRMRTGGISDVVKYEGADDLEYVEDIDILAEIVTPKPLMQDAENQFTDIMIAYEDYKNGGGLYKHIDLTDLIYIGGKKVNQATKEIMYKHLGMGEDEFKCNIELKLGISLPTSTQLNKQTVKNKFKVILCLKWMKTKVEYVVITDMGENVLINTDASSVRFK